MRLTLLDDNPLTHQASHSLPNSPPFYPRHLVVPAWPSLAVACCVYLPACWLWVRTVVGVNDCVVLPQEILYLSLLSVSTAAKFRPQWMRLLSRNCSQLVCHQLMISCVYTFLLSLHHSTLLLEALSSLFKSGLPPARRSLPKGTLAVSFYFLFFRAVQRHWEYIYAVLYSNLQLVF